VLALQMGLAPFLLQESILVASKISTEKRQYLPHYLSNKGFKGTVVNRKFPILHGGLVEFSFIAESVRRNFL